MKKTISIELEVEMRIATYKKLLQIIAEDESEERVEAAKQELIERKESIQATTKLYSFERW
jgi:hypothetical protein